MMIAPCTCTHAYQDELHGAGNRVHNKTAKGRRCTVCGKETVLAGKGGGKDE